MNSSGGRSFTAASRGSSRPLTSAAGAAWRLPDLPKCIHHRHIDGGTVKKLAFAGPFLDPEGKPNGSLVVVDAPDMAGAQALSAADPYAKAGLFESVEIRPWNWTFNKPAAS